MQKTQPLFFLSLVMFINAISYGTIIPLMFPYASRFGLNPFQISLLAVSFSIAQFVATPLIGRLSDKYGRKPLLLISLLGSSLSLGIFAVAKSVLVLFLARTIDGLTGGNISVAQAVIADTTKGADRAKAFGIIGASFGFGFLIGPALGGLLSRFGLSVPFLFSAGLALVGVIVGYFTLKETAPMKFTKTKEPLIDIKKLVNSLSTPFVGIILTISLIGSIAQNSWIIGFQSFTTFDLKLDSTQIGLIFSMLGFIGILIQAFGIKLVLKKFKNPRLIMKYAFLCETLIMASIFFIKTIIPFIIAVALYAIFMGPTPAMLNTLLSENTLSEDQGSVLGLNQAYISLGQIIGPLAAGFISNFSVPSIFLLTALLWAVSFRLTSIMPEKAKQKADF